MDNMINGPMAEMVATMFGQVIKDAVAGAVAPLQAEIARLSAEQAKVSELVANAKGSVIVSRLLGINNDNSR